MLKAGKLAEKVNSLKKEVESSKAELNIFKSIVEKSNDGILLTTTNGKILYANNVACRIFGRTKKEILTLGRNDIADMNDPEQAEKLKIRESKKGAVVEFWIRRKNGVRIPIEISFNNFTTSKGIRTSVVFREIAERKKKQDELRLSERRYRKLFENSFMGISHVAEDGTLIEGNDAYAKIYGFNSFREMALKVKNVKTLYALPGERNSVMKKLNEDKIIGPKEFLVKRKDGTKIYILATVQKIYDDNGRFLYNEATHIDISERKRLELLKNETEEIFHNTIENALIVIYAINRKGKYVLSEGKGLYKTGLKPGEAVGWSAFEVNKELSVTLSDGKVVLFPQLIKKVFSGQSFKCWTVYNNIHFEHQVIPLFGANGKVKTMLGVATDITEIKKREDEIIESMEKLRALSARLHQVREEERIYLARELHDNFSQSLTGIKMDLDWIMKRICKTNDNFSTIQKKIKSNISLLDSSIKEIRKISTDLRPVYLDMLGLIPAIEWSLEELKNRDKFKISFKKNINKIEFDQIKSSAIYRIVQEALTNVIRHSRADRVNCSILKGKDSLKIEISDNGIGITNQQLTGKDSLGITGMKERALIIGADILITGEKHKGTKMILSIPLVKR